jgi:predicted acyltransferase
MTSIAALGSSPRPRAALPFALIGSGCVVVGGLVAAATAHVPSEHALWAVAYVVLIMGVAQIALGCGQAWLPTRVPSPRALTAQLLGWNAGNAAVLAGTLSGLVPLTDVGGVLLVCTLVLLLRGTRGAEPGWLLRAYRLLVTVLAVSIPIGLILAVVTPH